MIGTERLLAAIRREIERTSRKLHKQPRVGFVKSYDKKQYAVKVQLLPEGTLSGWIGLAAEAVGNQFGRMSAPNIGDQVEIGFQGGDVMTARVTRRHFSIKHDKPPQIEAGEYHDIHQTGTVVRHTKDGTLLIGGAGFVKTGDRSDGKAGNLSTGQSQGQNDNPNQQGMQQQQQPAGKQSLIFNPDGSSALNVPDPNAQGPGTPTNPQHTATVKKNITYVSQQGNISHTAQQGNISNTAQQDITHTSQQGNLTRSAQNNITDTAQTIGHTGDVDVTGDLEISSFATASAFNISSDRRIKSDFSELKNVLQRALRLPICSFTIHPSAMIDGEIQRHAPMVDHGDGNTITFRRNGQSRKTIGAIAQDVRELFPEIVHGDEAQEILQLEEGKLGIIALRALQEYAEKTDRQIAELKTRIAELENPRR